MAQPHIYEDYPALQRMHRFSYFSNCKRNDLSITEKIEEEILTIPLHANMKIEYIERVIEGVSSFFKK